MNTLGDVLEFAGHPERVRKPEDETFITIKMRGGGAVRRQIGAGKTPVTFTGYRVKAGQFIYSRIDARNGAFAEVPKELDGAVVSKDFPVFNVRDDRVDRSYLQHFFRSGVLQQEIRASSLGATNRQRISEERFLAFGFHLPQIEEQRRIAAILDRADDLSSKRQKTLSQLADLRAAAFIDRFGDPRSWAKRWPMATIGDLTQSARYGTSSRAGTEGGFPVLRMGNITSGGELDLRDLKYMDLAGKDVDRYTVREGDILFNRTNSPQLVGKTAVVKTSEALAYAGYLVRLRLAPPHEPDFVSGYLNSRHGKATLRGMCKSIVGQANINAKEVQAIRIAVPPADVQRDFAEATDAISICEVEARKATGALGNLFVSLQSRAFSGRL